MPLYEYACNQCGDRLEVLQRIGAGPEGLRCPGCGSTKLEKEFSTFASCGGGGGGADCAPQRGFT